MPRNGPGIGKKGGDTGFLERGGIRLKVVLSTVLSTVPSVPGEAWRGTGLTAVGNELAENQLVAAENPAPLLRENSFSCREGYLQAGVRDLNLVTLLQGKYHYTQVTDVETKSQRG